MSRYLILCAGIALLAVRGFGDTVSISYNVTPVSGDTYIYTYSVYNNGSLPNQDSIELLDIYFNPSLYDETSLTVTTQSPISSQWSEDILYAVGNPPASYEDYAAFDAESMTGGIPVGGTVTGFSVEFNYLGQGTPGAQEFDIWEPPNYNEPIQTGFTFLAQSNDSAVPEPSTASCMFAILLAWGAWRMSRKLLCPVSAEVEPKRAL